MKPHPRFFISDWRRSAGSLLGIATLAFALPVLAHEGHDHGAPVPVIAGQPAPARFVAASEEFEVVGVLANDGVTLYLDDTATNRPLDGATLEIASAGLSGIAAPIGVGTYRLPLKTPLPAGKYALALTVITAGSSDLLSATLAVGVATTPATATASVATGGTPLRFGAAALLLAALGGVFYYRRQKRLTSATGK